MKLLFLAHRIPYPPNKGDKIRSYHELRSMIERGHEVHLLAFADEPGDVAYRENLSRICASVEIVPLRRIPALLRGLGSMIAGQSLTRGYFASSRMKRLVEQTVSLHQFDAVLAYSAAMAQYVPDHLSSRTVIDLVDVDSEKFRDYSDHSNRPLAWIYNLEWKRLRGYEYGIISRFAHTVLTTDREVALLDELDEFTRRARLRVINNGVDLDYFQPDMSKSDSLPPRLVFVGAMDYLPNIDGIRWFVDEIYPSILDSEPETELMIVGRNPVAEVKKLGLRAGITVTGPVVDVRPYLRGATACIIPLRIARGVQNKALEAMASGKAIIATTISVAGLGVTSGEQLLIAGEPGDFAQSTIKVIRDRALRDRLSLRSRRFAEHNHDWAPLLQGLNDLLESIGSVGDYKINPPSIARIGHKH